MSSIVQNVYKYIYYYYFIIVFLCVVELVFMAEWWAETEISVYIDPDDYEKYYGKEHAFLLMNHCYEIDWLMGWQFCDGIEVLGVIYISNFKLLFRFSILLFSSFVAEL